MHPCNTSRDANIDERNNLEDGWKSKKQNECIDVGRNS